MENVLIKNTPYISLVEAAALLPCALRPSATHQPYFEESRSEIEGPLKWFGGRENGELMVCGSVVRKASYQAE